MAVRKAVATEAKTVITPLTNAMMVRYRKDVNPRNEGMMMVNGVSKVLETKVGLGNLSSAWVLEFGARR